MPSILDPAACRFFAPKELHPHIARFDQLLSQLVSTQADVATYVQNPFALFNAEHRFPIIHLVALLKDGKWNMFRGSPTAYVRREGHRTVDENGDPNSHGLSPILQLEVVSDDRLTAAFDVGLAVKVLSTGVPFEELDEFKAYSAAHGLAKQPAILFSAPLPMMMKMHAAPFLAQRFTLYQHIFGDGHEYPIDGLFYLGITARDWKTRWAEHLRAINKGSRLTFHREYRNRITKSRLTYVHHKVMGVAGSLERIQDLEEALVRGHWEDARRLNMIPGGRAGLTYLREHGMWGQAAKSASPELAEQALGTWLKEHPRKGLPAPWMTELWKDDEYALNVICGRDGRLSVDQVRRIRMLAREGVSAELICQEVGAFSAQQVCRVVEGKTYSRVSNCG